MVGARENLVPPTKVCALYLTNRYRKSKLKLALHQLPLELTKYLAIKFHKIAVEQPLRGVPRRHWQREPEQVAEEQ